MNVLVTGATGFIGRHVVQRLRAAGRYRLVLLVRDPVRARRQIGSSVPAIGWDLRDDPAPALARLSGQVDTVVHLGASLQYHGSRRLLHSVNVDASLRLLREARRHGIRRFVFASSVEAMGPVAATALPAPETDPCVPVSRYGASKLLAEQLLTREAAAAGVALTILRFANVYDWSDTSFPRLLLHDLGTGGRLQRFFPVIRDLVIHPVHVEDAAAAVESACRTPAEGLFHVAGPRYWRIGEMAQILGARHPSAAPDRPVGPGLRARIRGRRLWHRWRHRADLLTYWTAGRPPRVHRGYSIQAARDRLQFMPCIPLEEGPAAAVAPGR